MWNIRKIISKGDYIYALVPEHPKATKNNYVLMHRVVMENYLGRMLTEEEVVHHKDHNKKNNSIENLELIERVTHIKKHSTERGRKIIKLKCPWCEKEFIKYKNQTHLQKPSKYNCTCCSKTCRGKLHRYIQLKGRTLEIQEKINSNIISENIRYLKEIRPCNSTA